MSVATRPALERAGAVGGGASRRATPGRGWRGVTPTATRVRSLRDGRRRRRAAAVVAAARAAAHDGGPRPGLDPPRALLERVRHLHGGRVALARIDAQRDADGVGELG